DQTSTPFDKGDSSIGFEDGAGPEQHSDFSDGVSAGDNSTLRMKQLGTNTLRGQRKFLVFEKNLMPPFKTCDMCSHHVCDCGHTRRLESQPKINSIPAGNLLSAGILFAGCSPSKVLRVFEFMNIMAITLNTFFDHQRTFWLGGTHFIFSNRCYTSTQFSNNEVKSSYHMELEGLMRALSALERGGIEIADIITDRHMLIQKWLFGM
ncbi:hypothetical protein MAR_019001, partial [Mya arenaria]